MEPTGTNEYEEGAKLFGELTECARNLWFELKANSAAMPDLGKSSPGFEERRKEYLSRLRKALKSCNEWADGHSDAFSNTVMKWKMKEPRTKAELRHEHLWLSNPFKAATLDERLDKNSENVDHLLELAINSYRVAKRFRRSSGER